VTCHFLDVYFADQARAAVPETVSVVCSPDLPTGEFDLVAFPLKSKGEAELTHELLQAGYLALRDGGRMLASTDAPRDSWLHDELRALFPKVTREPHKKGVRYLATKTGPLKKVKHFDCEFAFRDQGRLIHAVSRPGVFSHRRIDGGARALINIMQVEEGFRVLDVGCGTGVVGFAAAFRAPGVSVLAVDSNSRAIQCTERGAALNGLTNISTLLNAEGDCDAPGTYDLVLGNPPYFSNYKIADIFLQAALRALKPGGQVLIVTKTPHWFEERMPQLFDDVRVDESKGYVVLSARQR
jgi:16S rRNA (guanine1207-N2)-methyltransferase